MKHKISGAILLGFAGFVMGIGIVGAQIANAIVLSGFYAGNKTGVVPPGPQNASIHGLVIVTVIVLAISGSYFLIRPEKE
jgi:hypothetical protein